MEIVPSISALFLFYLLLIQNYINQLVPCGLHRLLSCSMIAKHVVGFLSLTFSIILVASNTKSFNEIVYQSFILYILFLVSSRLSQKVSVLFLVVCCIIYILYLYKNTTNFTEQSDVDKKYITISIWALTISLYMIGGVGFVFYYRKKKLEYGKRFNHVNFLFGKLQCKSFQCKK